MWKLSVFCDAVGRCSDTVLGAECHKWSNALVQLLQVSVTCHASLSPVVTHCLCPCDHASVSPVTSTALPPSVPPHLCSLSCHTSLRPLILFCQGTEGGMAAQGEGTKGGGGIGMEEGGGTGEGLMGAGQ